VRCSCALQVAHSEQVPVLIWGSGFDDEGTLGISQQPSVQQQTQRAPQEQGEPQLAAHRLLSSPPQLAHDSLLARLMGGEPLQGTLRLASPYSQCVCRVCRVCHAVGDSTAHNTQHRAHRVAVGSVPPPAMAAATTAGGPGCLLWGGEGAAVFTYATPGRSSIH
jgi:hypothetical protein